MAIITEKNRFGSYHTALNHVEIAVRNHLWLFIALLIWSVPTLAQGQNAKKGQVVESTLSIPVDVWNVLRSNLSTVNKVEDLPESVRAALSAAFHQHELVMGDRDHQVKPRCPDCPVVHLIFAGISSDACVVHYSTIGLGPSYDLLVFDNTGQTNGRLLWAARGVRANDLEQLRSLIAEGKFHPYAIQQSPRR